jgi:hypothetical protein
VELWHDNLNLAGSQIQMYWHRRPVKMGAARLSGVSRLVERTRHEFELRYCI